MCTGTYMMQLDIWAYIGNTEVLAKRDHPNQKLGLYSRLRLPTGPISDCKTTSDFPGAIPSSLPQVLDFSSFFIYPSLASWILAMGWAIKWRIQEALEQRRKLKELMNKHKNVALKEWDKKKNQRRKYLSGKKNLMDIKLTTNVEWASKGRKASIFAKNL